METNNTYYVVWQSRSAAQVVTVTSAKNELGAVAVAAPKCKLYDRSEVEVFTEEQMQHMLGKKGSCRCYSGDQEIVYAEEYRDRIKISSTQLYDDRDIKVEGISQILLTMLVYAYEHETDMVIGSIKGFPSITILASAFDERYAEPYIE